MSDLFKNAKDYLEKNKTKLKNMPFGSPTRPRGGQYKDYYSYTTNSLYVNSRHGDDLEYLKDFIPFVKKLMDKNKVKKVKKLVVNLKGAETINLKKIMVNGKKKLVPATEIDEYKIYGIDLKRQQEIFKKEDLTRFNRYIKDLTDFFNRDSGVYTKALDIKSGKDLKEVYNSVLTLVKRHSDIFIIPIELEEKINKKIKNRIQRDRLSSMRDSELLRVNSELKNNNNNIK